MNLLRSVTILLICAVAMRAFFSWTQGATPSQIVIAAFAEIVILSVFWFAVSQMIRMPFLDFRDAARSLLLVFLIVVLLLFYVLPVFNFLSEHSQLESNYPVTFNSYWRPVIEQQKDLKEWWLENLQ